jgi:hypothetical protein
VNFLKSVEFGETSVSNDATENAWLYVCQEMVPSSQQPPEDGCWVPFYCSWGTEGGPMSPRPGVRHTLQPDRLPSCGTWGGGGGHICSPPGA